MAAPIEFYFDFSSPYGYITSHLIDDLAAKHGREVIWRPYLMGAAFSVTGINPPDQQAIRFDYARHDFERTARFHGIPFKLPEAFPIAAVAPCRAVYWLAEDAEKAKAMAKALYHAYFVDGRNISDAEVTADVAAELGHSRDAALAGLQDPAVKDRLKSETGAAIERGIFGSPFIIIDGEAFWGSDRLDMVDKWLETGGW
jgi:2-hydroxychromene-2-carboxylate isomerase